MNSQRMRVERLLLTNDDGIDAPGLQILEQIAHCLSDDVWVVAPIADRSGLSNALSLREPVRMVQKSEQKYAVYGTPADCVSIAINSLMKDALPQLILSGINRGSNLGFEALLSGTVGAATTGTLHGIRSIALSQCYENGQPINWLSALKYSEQVICWLLESDWPMNITMNINFPAMVSDMIKGIRMTQQESVYSINGIAVTETVDPQGESYYWLRAQYNENKYSLGSDVQAVQSGFISVTPISADRTCGKTLSAYSAK